MPVDETKLPLPAGKLEAIRTAIDLNPRISWMEVGAILQSAINLGHVKLVEASTNATEGAEPETLRDIAKSKSLNGHPYVRLALRTAADVIERLRAECVRLHDIVGLGSYDDEDCTCVKHLEPCVVCGALTAARVRGKPVCSEYCLGG